MREHAELLTSVRNDISEYKVSNTVFIQDSRCRDNLTRVYVFLPRYVSCLSVQVLDMYHKCNGVYSQASGSLSPGPRILRERGAIHQINVKVI